VGLAVGDPGEDAVEVVASEGPLKRPGDLPVVGAEGPQPVGESVHRAKSLGVSALRCTIENSSSA
jgi:hypothetical protein